MAPRARPSRRTSPKLALMVEAYVCAECQKEFTISASVRAKYPNWTPRQCMDCRSNGNGRSRAGAKGGSPRTRSVTSTKVLTTAEVLERFEGGPTTGIFTDGSCQPNPGPGGWGAVYVVDNQVIDQRHGAEMYTTNNRMELTAMIAGLELAPADSPITIYSDSNLVVQTLNQWAKGWEARGWRRKEGEVMNVDLVKRAWELVQQKPLAKIQWIRAHDGSRWNEYADALSTAHLRTEV